MFVCAVYVKKHIHQNTQHRYDTCRSKYEQYDSGEYTSHRSTLVILWFTYNPSRGLESPEKLRNLKVFFHPPP